MQARRLPLATHMPMIGDGSQRNAKWAVLNVDTVVQVLAGVHKGQSWREALEAHVPLRKRQLQHCA